MNILLPVVSSSNFQCNLRCFRRTPMCLVKDMCYDALSFNVMFDNQAHVCSVHGQVSILLEMDLGLSRLFDETSALARKMLLTLVTFSLHRFRATFCICAWAVMINSCSLSTTSIFLVIETFSVRLLLSCSVDIPGLLACASFGLLRIVRGRSAWSIAVLLSWKPFPFLLEASPSNI